MKRYWRLLILAALSLGALLAVAPASAAPRQRCFSETGQCISGSILDYWERNGGLPTFGYPITAQYVDTVEGWTGPLQWFQRDRLEDHGRLGVLAGRLGAFMLEYQGRPWETFPKVGTAPRGCRFFPETGHSLCGAFLNYWQANGGLARFGYPVTEPFQERLDGWYGTVQYFERRRMEHHLENAGTKYEVLLGLLGRAAYDAGTCYNGPLALQATVAAYRNTLCAVARPRIDVPLAVQQFERGSMLWVKGANPSTPGTIYMIFYDNNRGSLVWQSFADYWREGDPISRGETPPAGLYEPIRGFGKIWYENPQVANTLGWAAFPEYADYGAIQPFIDGTQMIHRSGADRVFILYADGRADDIMRIW
jgi:hypothetical protein